MSRPIDIDSPTIRAVFRRALTGVGTAGLDQILIDALGEVYGRPEPVDATADAMTRGNDLRTIGELDDRHMGRTVRIGALTGTLTGLIGCADRVQAVLIVGGSRVFTDALSADEHVEVWRRTGGAA